MPSTDLTLPRDPLRLSWRVPLGLMMAAVYGSLIPFDFDLSGWSGVSSMAQATLIHNWTTVEDIAVNVLIYVPIGLAIVLAGGRAKRSILLRTGLAVVAGAGVALTCEVTQLFLVSRVGSWCDFYLNTLGTALGAVAGIFLQSITPYVVGIAGRRTVRHPMTLAATTLTIGLFLFHLAPFDFSGNMAELRASFRGASWQLSSPFSPSTWVQAPQKWIADTSAGLWFGVLAYLIVVARRAGSWDARPAIVSAVKHGIILAWLIELTELLTRTQHFDLSTIVLRIAFTLTGAFLAANATMPSANVRGPNVAIRTMPLNMLLAMLVIQIGLILSWSLRPQSGWQNVDSSVLIEWMPFASLWRQTAVHAALSVASQMISTGALLLTVALVVRRVIGMRSVQIASVVVITLSVAAVTLRGLVVSAHLDVTEPVVVLLSVLLMARLYKRAVSSVPALARSH